MNNFDERELISIGRIVNTHGIQGKLRVIYYNEDKTRFLSYKTVLLRDPRGHLQPLEVADARIHRKYIIVQLKGLENIDQAESLVGCSVLVERRSLPKLETGEYYWADLIGMEVTTEEGERLGQVETIIPTSGIDVLVTRLGEKEVLIPATEDVIKQVDITSRRVVVHLLEGLI